MAYFKIKQTIQLIKWQDIINLKMHIMALALKRSSFVTFYFTGTQFFQLLNNYNTYTVLLHGVL